MDTLRKFIYYYPGLCHLFSFPVWGCLSALVLDLILWWLFRPVILFFRLLVWGASGQHQSYQKVMLLSETLLLRPGSLVCVSVCVGGGGVGVRCQSRRYPQKARVGNIHVQLIGPLSSVFGSFYWSLSSVRV